MISQKRKIFSLFLFVLLCLFFWVGVEGNFYVGRHLPILRWEFGIFAVATFTLLFVAFLFALRPFFGSRPTLISMSIFLGFFLAGPFSVWRLAFLDGLKDRFISMVPVSEIHSLFEGKLDREPTPSEKSKLELSAQAVAGDVFGNSLPYVYCSFPRKGEYLIQVVWSSRFRGYYGFFVTNYEGSKVKKYDYLGDTQEVSEGVWIFQR